MDPLMKHIEDEELKATRGNKDEDELNLPLTKSSSVASTQSNGGTTKAFNKI